MRQSWQLVGLILSFGACILIFPSVEVVQLTTLLSLNNANVSIDRELIYIMEMSRQKQSIFTMA